MISRRLFRTGQNCYRRFALRYQSSQEEGSPQPLILYTQSESSCNIPLLLSQPDHATVDSVESFLAKVNEHYSQGWFVGGMGESDPGVWIVAAKGSEALNEVDFLRDAMQAVQEERHGVPFTIYTSGVCDVPDSLKATLNVSLWTSRPDRYKEMTGHDYFGEVCGFIASATEQGASVEVSVLPSELAGARDLAMSLGAQDVHAVSK